MGDALHKSSELGLGSGVPIQTHFEAFVKLWVPGWVHIFDGKTSTRSEQTLWQDPSRRVLQKELFWVFSSRGSFSSPFLCHGHHLGVKARFSHEVGEIRHPLPMTVPRQGTIPSLLSLIYDKLSLSPDSKGSSFRFQRS